MTDILQGWFAYLLMNLPSLSVVLNIIFIIVIAWFIFRTVNSKENDLDWADLVSSRGIDGNQHADIDKIGKVFGLIIAVFMPFYYAHSEKMDAGGLTLVTTLSLGYLGGVSGYSAWLRSKQESK